MPMAPIPPSVDELMAEAEATPGTLHGYCLASTRRHPDGEWLNCNRPLNHPRDFHADFGVDAIGTPPHVRGMWDA